MVNTALSFLAEGQYQSHRTLGSSCQEPLTAIAVNNSDPLVSHLVLPRLRWLLREARCCTVPEWQGHLAGASPPIITDAEKQLRSRGDHRYRTLLGDITV